MSLTLKKKKKEDPRKYLYRYMPKPPRTRKQKAADFFAGAVIVISLFLVAVNTISAAKHYISEAISRSSIVEESYDAEDASSRRRSDGRAAVGNSRGNAVNNSRKNITSIYIYRERNTGVNQK